MKILIAVDDSIHSQRAVDFAARMRWPAGSRMLVSSVLPVTAPIQTQAEMGVAVDPPEIREALHERHEALVTCARDQLRAAGFSAEGRVLEGDPRERLIEMVEQERVDLLVMGSRGRTGLARLLLGSVSSHAVAHAPCSVLVVKAAPKGGRS